MPPAEGLEEKLKPTGDAYQEQYLIREEMGQTPSRGALIPVRNSAHQRRWLK